MGQLSQKIFLQWLEIVLSQSWKMKFSLENNDTEQCFQTNVIYKTLVNLQITIQVELIQVIKNNSDPINVLCFLSEKWHFKILEPNHLVTKQILNDFSTVFPENSIRREGYSNFSKTKIVLICFCGIILALFCVVVIIMRLRNYMKRRTKLYRDALTPGLPAIYQDFDLNPRTQERQRYYHHDMQWTRHQHSYKRDVNSQMKPMAIYAPQCKDLCGLQKCKMVETVMVPKPPRNVNLRPLMNSCNLAELKRNVSTDNSKELILESSLTGTHSSHMKRRRHSLVDQIESVMNKHFDKNGVSKTWSNENLKMKTLNHNQNLLNYRPGTISKLGTRSNSKLPYRFRKAISLRRRLSIEEFSGLNQKTQSYQQNINNIS